MHQGTADDQRRLSDPLEEPDVRPGKALPDRPTPEGHGARQVRWPSIVPLQGSEAGVSIGPGAQAGCPQGRASQDQAKTSEVHPASRTSLEALELRSWPCKIEPELFILVRTGSFHVALTKNPLTLNCLLPIINIKGEKMGFRNSAKVFLLALILSVIVANVLFLLPSSAQAVPPKYNWVWLAEQLYHCEAAQADHCLPVSAYSF